MTDNGKTARFRDLHAEGTFVMPNPWDVGSARLLAWLGFHALATTSSGHAASIGRLDQHVARDELVAHAAQLARATDLPLNVDAERGFGADPAGVSETVGLLADAGAAGCSIEDYDPASQRIDDVAVAAERVAAAAEAARSHSNPVVVTARAENRLYGAGDLDDTIARLRAYADAGAEVVYAPGLVDLDEIATLVRSVGRPVNVLALPAGPSVADLAGVGVRRVSTGGALAFAAYGALVRAARELRDSGTSTYSRDRLSRADLTAALGEG